MLRDRFGILHASDSPEAVAAFEEAVHAVAAHLPSAGEALGRALEADPDLAAGHALKGLAGVVLAREEVVPLAAAAHRDAERALERRRGTPAERALTEALGLACAGRLVAAADRLEAHLKDEPQTLLAAKLAHALRFMTGDAPGMLAGTTRLLPRWSEEVPGYGFLLGCHAFALEEHGAFRDAERIGRQAVAMEPADAWGLHAVGHVYEMQGRVEDGIAWFEAGRPTWTACNNFAFHMAWHLALFHLERRDHGTVLSLYDTEVRPTATDDFRDMANAVSLLWRLEQDGVAVGERWSELGELALKRRRDMTLTFAALHNLVALLAVGEVAAARDLVQAMDGTARGRGGTDQEAVMSRLGLDLAKALLSLAAPRSFDRSSFERIATDLPRVGGSHAQRDVFIRTLASLAAQRGDRESLERVLAVRRRLKRDDRFALDVERRLAAAEARQARPRAQPPRNAPWTRPAAAPLPL
jgi:hypothetical protein